MALHDLTVRAQLQLSEAAQARKRAGDAAISLEQAGPSVRRPRRSEHYDLAYSGDIG